MTDRSPHPLRSSRTVRSLLVFTRYPQPGQAKTRLIPALGAAGAADLQRQMTEHTLAQARQLQAQSCSEQSCSVEIWFASSRPLEPARASAENQTGDLSSQSGQADSGQTDSGQADSGQTDSGQADSGQADSGQTNSGQTDLEQMRSWLGAEADNWTYQPQIAGDLGARLSHACQTAFAAGMDSVVTIGTDCPGLDAARLQQAFDRLQQFDLVLGPATDGGYYLIGLRRFVPELFESIRWGSEVVLQQTVAVAESLSLSIAYLDSLTDVDRPDDLAVWEAVKAQTESLQTDRLQTSRLQAANQPGLSVILPVLNEASSIQATVQALRQAADLPIEILAVDGGSRDDTVQQLRAIGVRVLETAAGRAAQMNAGAKAARGERLLFLHADTHLPDGFGSLVQQTLTRPGTVAGAFDLKIAGSESQTGLRWVERGVWLRSHWLQMPYGDQALFLRAETFWALGGFAQLPIMEDFELVQRLKRQGQIAIAPAAVVTSGRRWQKLGVIRTTLINQLVILAYSLGVSPARIARWYRAGRLDLPAASRVWTNWLPTNWFPAKRGRS